jgi:hypothetical protein
VFSFYSSFVGLIFSETLYSMLLLLLVYMIHDKGKLFPIVDSMARHYESKILTLQSLYSPKECTTDAVLQKYGDTLARCTSFGPYFNNGNQNLPRLKITTANACATRPPKTVGIYGGGGEEDTACPLPAFWYLHAVQWETTLLCIYHICYNKKCI